MKESSVQITVRNIKYNNAINVHSIRHIRKAISASI